MAPRHMAHRVIAARSDGGSRMSLAIRAIGTPLDRIDGPPKVTGAAKYAYEHAGEGAAALASAAVSLDQTYTTPAYPNNPLEPHTTVAHWGDDGVTLYDSNQGAHAIREIVVGLFRLPPERVRVISPYVGGAFGSK